MNTRKESVNSLLISMPWAIATRPSIQLGALKSFIEQNSSHTVDLHHHYLTVAAGLGLELYTAIADSGWAGEALYSSLLFPDNATRSEQLYSESLPGKPGSAKRFNELRSFLQRSAEQCLTQTDWSKYQLVGFSICFDQLLASLYFASLLKQHPQCPAIVFGGSSCGGSLGRSLLAHFPMVDYVIDGEGEGPLAGLCDHLCNSDVPLPERVLSRIPSLQSAAPEIADLNTLPTPDYSAYFAQLGHDFPASPFVPTLPLEFSRGCWWNRCTFCNLNLQWCRYRYKSADKVRAELNTLLEKYQSLDYTFTDNALPPREITPFFESLKSLPADLRFFAEIRTLNAQHDLTPFRQGGLDTIQVGIESLSVGLLKSMQKGISVIDNIGIMKEAMRAGIALEGNLILEFPGSTQEMVDETLENLEYVLPFRPLSAAAFFLGHASPVAKSPRDYAIKAIVMHRKNRFLFPAHYHPTLQLLIRDYRGDRIVQRQRWLPVKEQLTVWQDFHVSRDKRLPYPLSYRDGGTFLLIRQETVQSLPLRHKLQGLSRQIYLFCDTIRTLEEIGQKFNSVQPAALLSFIQQLCKKRIMFREGDRVLSLAIRHR